MRAHTINTMSKRNRRRPRRALALALGVCALVIPSTANAGPRVEPPINGESTSNAEYSSVTSIAPPVSESSGSSVDSGYSSLNAITGPPAETPTLVSSSQSSSDDGFDWASALVGAGAALALAALGSAALMTVRRRSTVTPTPSTS
jgi:hypothetical protein